MADRISSFKVSCIGGLNTNRDMLMQGSTYPGSAIQLINYEPSITGGYRRISGFTNIYGTVPGQLKVLGVAVAEGINDGIFAWRRPVSGDNYFFKWNNTLSNWDAVSTTPGLNYANIKKIRHVFYNWSTPKLVIVDGVNPAAIYNGTTYTQITSSLAPSAPKYATIYKSHLFLAGNSTDPQNLYFSAPLEETSFDPALGSGVINVGFDIVQIKAFRNSLYIFGKNAIKKLEGRSIVDFVVSDVTTNLGCLISDSVIEIAGDLLFFGPDGFRPVAGTSRIGDVELQTVSKQIQATVSAFAKELVASSIDQDTISSVVIRGKSQFRLLIESAGLFGFLGGLRQSEQGISFEFTQIYGIPASCATSGYINSNEIVIHGDASGKVHLQESGSSFNNTPVLSIFQTPYYYFDDPTIRKNFYNITTFLRGEGSARLVFGVSYDFDDSINVFNPANYEINTEGAAAYYNEAVYDSTAIYDGNPSPVTKTNVAGSGFSVSFKYVTEDTNESHTIQGFVLNYSMNDRR